MSERRKKLRYDVAAPTKLVAGGKSFDCAVTDIGMGGVLLSVKGDFEQHVSVGEQGELRGPVESIFSGEIVRVNSGTVALKADVSETSANFVLDTIFNEGN
jgi:hypothetical protein